MHNWVDRAERPIRQVLNHCFRDVKRLRTMFPLGRDASPSQANFPAQIHPLFAECHAERHLLPFLESLWYDPTRA